MRGPLALAIVLLLADWVALDPSLALDNSPGIIQSHSFASVGETSTFGWLTRPEIALRRVLGVQVVDSSNVRVVGYGARRLRDTGAIGIAPGWPPEGYTVDADSGPLASMVWDEPIEIDIGVQLLENIGGVRGLRITYVDPYGRVAIELVDWAFYACVGDCPDSDDALSRLGLI